MEAHCLLLAWWFNGVRFLNAGFATFNVDAFTETLRLQFLDESLQPSLP